MAMSMAAASEAQRSKQRAVALRFSVVAGYEWHRTCLDTAPNSGGGAANATLDTFVLATARGARARGRSPEDCKGGRAFCRTHPSSRGPGARRKEVIRSNF